MPTFNGVSIAPGDSVGVVVHWKFVNGGFPVTVLDRISRFAVSFQML